MPFKKKPENKAKQRYKDACRSGYCPSLADRENSRIRELANRLKADSKKETLTNISEWQNNNLKYWFERFPLSSILIGFSVSFILFLIISRVVYGISHVYIIWLWWLVEILGIITATLLAVTILMFIYYRKLSLKHFFKIFRSNLSPDFLLEKKLAVCRDYAKLSANLLFNIYPESYIYFVHATMHLATGIFVEEKLYILDKYLPVATFEKWHEKWHKCRFSDKTVEKAKGNSMELVADLNSLLSKTSGVKLDTDKLANEMKRLLRIQSSINADIKSTLRILHWKKGAVLYEDDEIVNYSLAQRLKTLISAEIFEVSQITDLKIFQDEDDLTFEITFRSKK